MFENWMLRRIFRPQRVEVTGGWKNLHNEWAAPPDTINMIESRRKRLAGNVAHMGAKRNVYTVLVAKLKGKTYAWTLQGILE
jgi:hypothetical protein